MAWQFLRDFAAEVNEVNQDRQDAKTNPAGSVPLASPADILAAVEVVDAFYRSLRSGKAESIAKA
jgi:hypothetical protein